MLLEDDEKEIAKVIEFPRHRIVRWPVALSRDQFRSRLEKILRLVMELLRSA